MRHLAGLVIEQVHFTVLVGHRFDQCHVTLITGDCSRIQTFRVLVHDGRGINRRLTQSIYLNLIDVEKSFVTGIGSVIQKFLIVTPSIKAGLCC